MRQFILLSLSLMLVYPSVSTIQLVYYSCDQTWMSQVPNAPVDASFAFSSDGAHMAIGELQTPIGLPGYPNATNDLIYITPSLPQILFAPLGPPLGPLTPWRIWMSADGNVIATALNGGGVQLFSQATPEYVWKFPGSNYNSLAVSGDGRYVPALIQNKTSNTLYLLSARNENITWSYHFAPLSENSTGIQPVAISYDGGRIAALLGRTVFVFSKNSNQTLWTKIVEGPQLGPYGISSSVYMSQDGNFLTAIDGANVTVYSADSGSVEKSFILGGNWGWNGAYTPDGLFSISQDSSTIAIIAGSKLSVFDRASGAELFSKTVMDQIQVGSGGPPSAERPYTVSVSQNGTVIAVGGYQHAVFVFDRSGNELCHTYAGPNITGSAAIVGISADGKHIGAFTQNFAELLTITPQYYLIILIVVGTPAAIVSGYLFIRHRKKAKQSGKVEKKVLPRQDPPDRGPGPFIDPTKARS